MTVHPLVDFDPLKTLQIISTERCNLLFAVPTMLIAMLQHPDFDAYPLSSLKVATSGGAPVPISLMQQVKARVRADVAIVFGQTENTGGMTLPRPNDPFERKSSTVGVPLPHVEAKIVDPATGKVVPCGERGEICCRGFLVMQGYYNMPEKTAQPIDAEGWLHTRHLQTLTSPAYLHILA